MYKKIPVYATRIDTAVHLSFVVPNLRFRVETPVPYQQAYTKHGCNYITFPRPFPAPSALLPSSDALWKEKHLDALATIVKCHDQTRQIKGEEPQQDADDEMAEERFREQIDHPIGRRIEQPEIIGEEQLMERRPETGKVCQDPDAQQDQKQNEQKRYEQKATAEIVQERLFAQQDQSSHAGDHTPSAIQRTAIAF